MWMCTSLGIAWRRSCKHRILQANMSLLKSFAFPMVRCKPVTCDPWAKLAYRVGQTALEAWRAEKDALARACFRRVCCPVVENRRRTAAAIGTARGVGSEISRNGSNASNVGRRDRVKMASLRVSHLRHRGAHCRHTLAPGRCAKCSGPRERARAPADHLQGNESGVNHQAGAGDAHRATAAVARPVRHGQRRGESRREKNTGALPGAALPTAAAASPPLRVRRPVVQHQSRRPQPL
mmetsp:Transcript_62654/g.181624  ORF Transcript_62654/g.181624 Transcript_62654/m.181624 type:complete len:237 (-) Transcript_62654:280-990(-)